MSLSPPAVTLGLAFVGTIPAAPEFFRILSRVWPGPVVIISQYDSVEELERDLEEFQIRYDKAVAAPHSMSNADIIRRENVAFYFDDRIGQVKLPARHLDSVEYYYAKRQYFHYYYNSLYYFNFHLKIPGF